jgi:hypothetical protein
VTSAVQDSSQEWITLLAAICADGELLPPDIIYASANSTIQSSWVADIEAGVHDVSVTSTPSGWSNNNVRLAWLEQVFERCTKQKARCGREYRLLIVDGYSSHLTKAFIEYCYAHCIILAVFPPHATHTLQPLDVVMFKPLLSSYTKHLTNYLQRSLGLVLIRKGDFFPLFWESWKVLFRKELVLKSFAATRIWPMDREQVLKRFVSNAQPEASNASAPKDTSWRQIERVV